MNNRLQLFENTLFGEGRLPAGFRFKNDQISNSIVLRIDPPTSKREARLETDRERRMIQPGRREQKSNLTERHLQFIIINGQNDKHVLAMQF